MLDIRSNDDKQLLMANLEEVYNRLQESKKKRRDISKMFKDELSNSARYQEIVEEMKTLRDEKKSIETTIRNSTKEYREIDDIKADIQTDSELLTDIVLNKFLKSEPVEIVDEDKNTWHPVFKVNFKKT